MFGDLSTSAIFVSLVCIGILILWDKVLLKRSTVFSVFPGPLAAVTFGILFQAFAVGFAPEWALDSTHLVTVPVAESFSEVLEFLRHPDWQQIANQSVWFAAITLAVVASLETLLCVDATDKLDPLRRVTPTSRELIAQGIGNVTSGMIGGLPITQVIIRSSANIQSGGRTKLSAILHGVFLLIFVLALPQVLNLIPLAALASILLVVGYKLAQPALFRQVYSFGHSQFLPFVITIIGIVLTDLLIGIALGMVVAHFLLLQAHYRNSHFLHIQESDQTGRPHEVSIRLAEEVTFLNKGAILKELREIPDGSIVNIDTSGSVFIDRDVLEVIEDFETSAPGRNIEVRKIGDPNEAMQGLRLQRRQRQEVTS
jgi:MFS superfamily sulfate permease-like transporter